MTKNIRNLKGKIIGGIIAVLIIGALILGILESSGIVDIIK